MTAFSSTTEELKGLSQQEVNTLFLQYGYNEIVEKKIPLWKSFLKNFWNISAWMLESIIIISLFLRNYSDALVVTAILVVNAIIVFLQDYRASDAVELLKKKLSISVNVLRDGSWTTHPARELVPGDVIHLRIGDFVPADLRLVQGHITVDQSSLTGESAGISKQQDDVIYSGSVVTQGEATALVTSTGRKTFYGKTIDLLKTASPESHVDRIIGKVIKWLSGVIGGMLLLAMVISVLKGISLVSVIPVMIILFMNAIPVGLTVMFSVSNAIGAKQLLKEGVLVTRMNAPNDAAGMDILCIDKTGTLTMNQLTVAELFPAEGFTEQDVVTYGVQASQEADHNAIDMAFAEAAQKHKKNTLSFLQKNFIPFTPETRRTEALIQSGGIQYTVYKGAFEAIAGLTGTNIEKDSCWQKIVHNSAAKGYRIIAVAKALANNPARLVGLAALFDPPMKDAGEMIAGLRQVGVSVILLTGDALPIATEIATKTGIGSHIIKASELENNFSVKSQLWNGVAEVYPEDKYKIVKALQANGHIVGMTGDGVNDAPALKQAEVGVAVYNAADVAKSAASIILTQEGLQGILSPIRIGRVMFERFNLWLLNKLSRTLLKVCFIIVALILFDRYVVSTTVLLLLLFLTDFVFISTSNDKVPVSPKPAQWNIPKVVAVGSVQGVLMTIEALGLLAIGWHFFDLASTPGQLYTFCYLILLFYSIISVFVIREKKHFWSSRPGMLDTLTLIGNFILGFILSQTGLLELKPLPILYVLFVIAYILFTSLLINDFIKIAMYRIFNKNQ